MEKMKCLLLITVLVSITALFPTEGRRFILRPLSSEEVYRELRDANRLDAIPEGRVVSQGIAALKGFALGVAKGAGIATVASLISSNMFGSNYTYNQNNTSGESTQEICFSSRSLNEINDVNDEDGDGRALTIGTSDVDEDGRALSIDSNGGDAHSGAGYSSQSDSSPTYADSNPYYSTYFNKPSLTDESQNDNSGTYADEGANSYTKVDTYTQTGNGAVTCVVVQKPNQ